LIGFANLANAYQDDNLHPVQLEIEKKTNTLATLEWSQANYKITNGTGTAKIIVTDSDMNKISNAIDTIDVFVSSDSFQEGVFMRLYETKKDSGIFEKTFTLSEKRSSPNILFVREGDTATVTYTDKTLPPDNVFSEIVLMQTTLIGSTGPPLERVIASNFRIEDLKGQVISIPTISEEKQVQLVANIKNQQDRNQNFVFFIQIQDSQGKAVSLSWITGTMMPLQSFSPSQSWIPHTFGTYTAQVFVWESVENPSALSPPLSFEISVKK